MKSIVNTKTLNDIDEIFNLIYNGRYEDAYNYIIEHTDNTQIDNLFREWIKALYEFYTLGKTDEATKLLENVLPTEISTSMDLRLYTSLLIFYHETSKPEEFYAIVPKIVYGLQFIKNRDLKIKAIYNIANGYYEFEDYINCYLYADYCINLSKNFKIITKIYALSLLIKSMAQYEMGVYSESDEDIVELKQMEYLISDMHININQTLFRIKEKNLAG